MCKYYFQILDSVVRLGSIFLKLVSDGCELFLHWCVKIVCNPNSKVCVIIRFGSDQESQSIRTRVDEENKDVILVTQQLARFLEQCHVQWLNYIDRTRDNYFCLTYFTIDQMVILQKELVKVESAEGPSPLIFHLLSAVKKGCTKQDLAKAISSVQTNAITKGEQTGRKKRKAKPNSTTMNKSKYKIDIQKSINTFSQKIDESDFSFEIEKEALNNVNTNDIERGK